MKCRRARQPTWETLFRAASENNDAVPGIIMVIHTYGRLVNLDPYLDALVTDGVFTATGWFVGFPKIDLFTLEHLLRHRVLQMFLRERGIDEAVIRKLLGSKMHPVLKRNFELFSAGDWLAALTAHIPNAGEHLVRYYGWYGNVDRAKRRKTQGGESTTIEEFTEVSDAAAKRTCARLIKQVYEVDPLSARAAAEQCAFSPSSNNPRLPRRSSCISGCGLP